jgi:methyl-accepting chemotaxis protein
MPEQPDKPKRTIDERLQNVAMHLEIIAGMQEATDKRLDRLSDKVERLSDKVDKISDNVAKISDNVAKMADSINTLGRIAGFHEQRLDEAEMSLDTIIERLQRLERDRKRPQA